MLETDFTPRLAIVTTHPIQYYAPIFQMLTERGKLQIKVFYTWEQSQNNKYDPGFQQTVQWDLPLLEGYAYTFVRNKARKPGSSHFWGVVNPTLIGEINEWAPQAILVVGWSYYSHLRAMQYFKGRLPIFFRGDSTLLNERRGIKQLARRAGLTWVYQYIDVAFYVGRNNQAYYQEHRIKPEQLLFAPHAIDNNRFQSQAEANRREALAWRRTLGISDEARVYLFVGKLEPVKNPTLLLEAFISCCLPQAHLIFVGNGVLEPELRSRARDYGLNVHFVSFQNQSRMPIVYQLGDIYVLCSRSETWGLAINEAMACGLAIIASDKVGSAADLVKSGENGYTFRSESKESLMHVLQKMDALADLTPMKEASKAIIQAWSFQNICERMEQGILTFTKHQSNKRDGAL